MFFLSLNGWLGYELKSSKELASEFSCTIKNIYGINSYAINKLSSKMQFINPTCSLNEQSEPNIDLSIYGAQYILGSINGWFGYPKKSINELASEFGCSVSNVKKFYLEYLEKLNTDPSLAFLGDEFQQKIEDYLQTLDVNSAYILASINGWLGYPKKDFETLASEFKLDALSIWVSVNYIIEIYTREYKKLKQYLFLEEDRERK